MASQPAVFVPRAPAPSGPGVGGGGVEWYSGPSSGGAGGGGGGAPGAYGLPPESSGVSRSATSYAPAPGGAGAYGSFEDEPPLLEELGIDVPAIVRRATAVLTLRAGKGRPSVSDDPDGGLDMGGPLVFMLLLGVSHLLVGKLYFGYILGWSVVGSSLLWVVVNGLAGTGGGDGGSGSGDAAEGGGGLSGAHGSLTSLAAAHPPGAAAGLGGGLSGPGGRPGSASLYGSDSVGDGLEDMHGHGHGRGGSSLYACCSTVGYGQIPLVLHAYLSLLLPRRSQASAVLGGLAVLWAATTATRMFVARTPGLRGKGTLVAYPAALMYLAFALLTLY